MKKKGVEWDDDDDGNSERERVSGTGLSEGEGNYEGGECWTSLIFGVRLPLLGEQD